MKWLLFLLAFGMCSEVHAQRVTLSQLLRMHSQERIPLQASLRKMGWRDKGLQNDLPHKPQLFIILDGDEHPTRLYVYRNRNKPLCKLEVVSDEVNAFNKYIRDSLEHYGFSPDLNRRFAEEENLKVERTAAFVNHDLLLPVHALILYFNQRNRDMVSLTLYSDE